MPPCCPRASSSPSLLAVVSSLRGTGYSYTAGPPVDTQRLNENLGTIVRAKDGCIRPVLPPTSSSPPTAGGQEYGQPRPFHPFILVRLHAAGPVIARVRERTAAAHEPPPARAPDDPGARESPVLVAGWLALELPPKAGHHLCICTWREAKEASASASNEWLSESMSASESEVEVEDSLGAPVDSSPAAPTPEEEGKAPLAAAVSPVTTPTHPSMLEGGAKAKGLAITFSWSDT
ncbi:hypothetical protein FB451DRAFT_1176801 [Mycena latifolia]|nr:hypothetical protein FB451DRAFT_1176801 [Mycena latifolia]